MHRFYNFIFFFLLSFTITHTFVTVAEDEKAASFKIQNATEELKRIDSQLSQLQNALEIYRKKAFNAEMNAQPYMIDNWHEFSQGIQMAEDDEKKIIELKQRIDALEKRKAEILEKQ